MASGANSERRMSCGNTGSAVGMDVFTDLDRTLIFSHRVQLTQPRVLAERLHGRKQSYMTAKALAFLSSARDIRLIPVTTRSMLQYERIELLGNQIPCHYALVCNGGELLIDGKLDRAWHEQTEMLYAPQIQALREVRSVFEELVPPRRSIHHPFDVYMYASVPDVQKTADALREAVSDRGLVVRTDSRKVFCLPEKMDKGAAMCRFQKRFGKDFCVAAGDSEFDIPMLNEADWAVTVPELADRVTGARVVLPTSGQVLSDALCDLLASLQS